MKKIIYIVLTFFLVSCNTDDFFDIEINNTFTGDNFWKDENHALLGINGTYKVMATSGMYNGGILDYARMTDNAYIDHDVIGLGTHTSSTSNIGTRYTKCYVGIGRANTVIKRVPDIEMEEELKNRIVAEAKFLRALFYSILVDYFGSVPLVTDEPDIEAHSTLPRSPHDAVVTQIIKDLDEAAAVLPESYSGSDVGRATKGAALALKTRVNLYEGKWTEASVAAQSVMSLGYSLFPDYRKLFMLNYENNQEVIFDVQYAGTVTTSFDVSLYQYDGGAALPNLVDSYPMDNGLPITDPASGYDPASPYENRDPRLLKTIAVPGSLLNGSTVTSSKYFRTGYGTKKYQVYSDSVVIPTLGDGESVLNFIVLRYADVLLMYAEAENEANGPSAAVFDALDLIRTRAGMPVVDRSLDKDALRIFIRSERRIELAGEALRYSDIRRWDIGEQVMNGDVFIRNDPNGDPVTVNRVFVSPKHNLWPIPQPEIDLNEDLLPQNSGW